ncbi:hypothetical protein BAMA_17910 [Bacillus manliponensis]|uniref:LXG domain-containing protein n=1 Tax=Bacillus manliponensis TaxID=574376 RepID=A0A073K1E9_9BACI|nr:AHH domain-containing protein [Bacillus manliponensis]KEK20310.1 hypothetical protein BAMA_17910 [Bacillus manliponensis]
MSLNMYIGEVQAQTESMNAFCNATIQGMEEVIRSIDAFTGDIMLQGKTYDSAKIFFVQTYRQLAQGIIYLCEELIRQNEVFPSDFQSEVATVDVIEQEILEQIRELQQMIAAIEAMSELTPETAAMLQIYHAMKRKLEDKLERLHQFNASSSNNYTTALQLATSIAKGLAEVQSGKGFQAVSGTFHIEKLNMEWAKPIQVITEERNRQAEKLKVEVNDNNTEKSLLEKILRGIYYGSGKVIEGIEEGFDSLDDTVTQENLKYAVGHPIETFFTMWNTLSDSFINDVVHGDAESTTSWIISAFMEVGLGVVSDKGISKVSKIGKVTTLGEDTNVSKFSEVVSSITNKLPLQDRFAFVGASEFKNTQRNPIGYLKEAHDTFVFLKNGKSKIKDVQEVIKDYADKVLDRVNVKNEYPDSYTASKVLREELKDAGIEPPPYPNAAHHIVPWNDGRAVEVQELLKEIGIDPDSAANGVFLPYQVNDYVTTEVLHVGNHSKEYIREVTERLNSVIEMGGTQADIAEVLHQIRQELLEGKIKLNEPRK